MNELHIAMQPTGPGKAPITDPHDRVRTQPTRFASRLLWMLEPTQWGLEPQILRCQPTSNKIQVQNSTNLIFVIWHNWITQFDLDSLEFDDSLEP